MSRIILLTAPNSWSGVEIHTMQLASALKQDGHDVVIVEIGHQIYKNYTQKLPFSILSLNLGSQNSDNVPIEEVGFKIWWRAFRSLKADVVISVKGTFKFCSLKMEAAARLLFPCFIAIEHMHMPVSRLEKGFYFKGLLPSFGLWLYRQKFLGYLRSVFPHKVVCVSQAVVKTLEVDYGYPPRKLIAVHNGVDTSFFVPNPNLRNLAREGWGIPVNAFVFGTMGRLSPMKNHGQLISVFSILRQSFEIKRDIRLVIVGDGPLRSSLEALARSKGVQDYIVFVGFSGSPEKIYPGFDVLCFPSTTGESLPLALLEAMACGCPAIASAVGGIPEIINDSRDGWLIPMGDENALLLAMRLVLALESEQLLQIGVHARERVKSAFRSSDRLRELVGVIEETFLQVR